MAAVSNTPASNTNAWYVFVEDDAGSYDLSGVLTEFNIKRTAKTEETTVGALSEETTRAVGLKDTTATFSAGYIAGKVPQYIARIRAGNEMTWISCPEGNVSGKPMHKGKFIVKSTDGPKPSVDKKKMLFACELEQSEAPMVNMYHGGTVP